MKEKYILLLREEYSLDCTMRIRPAPFTKPRYRNACRLLSLISFSLVVSSLLQQPLYAQQSLPQLTRVDHQQANILLDGFVDEVVWDSIPAFDGMRVTEPDTLANVPYATDIRVFYTLSLIHI